MADLVIANLEWDEDAQEEAVREARQVAHRDPEAASLLLAQVVAVQETQEQHGVLLSRSPVDYDPIVLYEQVAHLYGWTPRQIDDIHYLTLFGLIREGNKRREQENDAYRRAQQR